MMRRTVQLALLGWFLLVACGQPPPGAAGGMPAPVEATTTTTTSEVPRDTYRYTITVLGLSGEGEGQSYRIKGAVDGDARIGEIRYFADDSASDETVIVQSPRGVAVLAPPDSLVPGGRDPEIDPEQWYELDVFAAGGPDSFFLSATPTDAAVWDLLGVVPVKSVDNGVQLAVADVDLESIVALRDGNTFLGFLSGSTDSLQVATAASDGVLRRVVLTVTEYSGEATITFEITDRGAPLDIFVPPDPEPFPVEVTLPPVTPAPTVPPPSIRPDAEGVLFRLSTAGGWELPQQPARQLSLSEDGRLVRVINPNVFASAADFNVLQLSPVGVARLVELIESSGLLETPRLLDGGAGVSPTDVTTSLYSGGRGLLSMDRVGQVDGYTAEQIEARQRFAAVIAQLEDPSWLGEDVRIDWEPWVPETLTVLAGDVSPRSGLPDDAPFAVWPLEQSIEELAMSTTRNPYGEVELVVCLTGDQVQPVWDLLTGVNNAYLRVDDGTKWELNYELNWPGYRPQRDDC